MDYLVIRSAGAGMAVLGEYVQPEGSERKAAASAALLGPADPDEMLSATVRVRRLPDTPPLPTAGSWAAVLLAKEPSRPAAVNFVGERAVV